MMAIEDLRFNKCQESIEKLKTAYIKLEDW